MKENQERLQEIYSAEQKPPLLGHIEKQEIDLEQPTSTQHERSVLLTEPGEQISKALQEQEQWDQLERRLSAEKNKQPEEKEISDLDLEAEMEREARNVQPGAAGDDLAEQTTNEADSTQWDPAGDEVTDSQTKGDENIQRDPTGGGDETAEGPTNESDQRDLAGFLPDLGEQGSEYSKHYKTGAQERSDRGTARREKQEHEERKWVRKQQEEIAERARVEAEKERGNQIVSDALLKEEEEEAKRWLAEICRIRRHRKKAKTTTSTKMDEERKRNKRRVSEDDEEDDMDLELVNDVDADPDYNPDDDVEDEQSVSSEFPDIMEVEKHVHCLNLADAGEFMVWVWGQLVELEHHVKVGGSLAESGYREFVSLLRDGIFKMHTWSPIEAADVNLVMKTVVDPTCTAWKKRMKGVKTRNCKQIWKQGDKREEVLRIAEERDIPDEADEVLPEGSLEDKSEEEQKEIRQTIKRYFEHVRRAHEEAACAAGKLTQLVDVLDREHFIMIARAGTRPLVALELTRSEEDGREKERGGQEGRS